MISTGRNAFHAIETAPEPPDVREERRRRTRKLGLLQLIGGLVLIAVFASSHRFIPTFVAGLIAAHGLFRLLFGSGMNRDDDDYDND